MLHSHNILMILIRIAGMLLTMYTLALPVNLVAQEKIEVEKKVTVQEVPPNAIQWVNSTFPNTRRIKWYYEQTSGLQSYEAKFKFQRQKYSVEFDTSGYLQDVEIETKWRRMSTKEKDLLGKTFAQIEKFDLKRIQIQYSDDPEELQKSFLQDQNYPLRKYEIEFTGIIDGEYAFWEGLISHEGIVLQIRKIVIPSLDNLEF